LVYVNQGCKLLKTTPGRTLTSTVQDNVKPQGVTITQHMTS